MNIELNLECPFNSLSFGAISFGITHELYKFGVKANIFPIGPVDISAYDKAPEPYKRWLQESISRAAKGFKRNIPSLRVWHLNQSWNKVSDKNFLLTFFECDTVTETELNIINQQDGIFVTSTESKDTFETFGAKSPIVFTPMGVDSLHFNKLNKQYYEKDVICWNLTGKYEARKYTEKVIKAWVKRFGNQKEHRLHCHVTNPFYKPEDMQVTLGRIFDGKQPPFNVQFFGYLPTLSHLNDSYNCTSIVIDMSGSEALSIPSLTMLSLGKHGVIHNNSAMKDWAGVGGATLVESSGKEPLHDSVFFFNGAEFNQGNRWSWNEEDFIKGCEQAIEKYKQNPVNELGFKLKDSYSYKHGVEKILGAMFPNVELNYKKDEPLPFQLFKF